MNRSAMREVAFKFLFSAEVQKELNEDQIDSFLDSNETTDDMLKEYITDIVRGINSNYLEIIKTIESNLKPDWKIERVSKVSLALLKLAIYEIKYKKLPYKAMINEVVELAKKYGEENTSKQFVNGILASIVVDM
jgi:N utilization substance protein B